MAINYIVDAGIKLRLTSSLNTLSRLLVSILVADILPRRLKFDISTL